MNDYNYNVSRRDDFDATASPLADVGSRSRFLMKTYLNLTGAVLLFAAIETLIFAFFSEQIIPLLFANLQATGGVLLALCLGGSFVTDRIASASRTRVGHYVALGLEVLLYVAIFLPILAVALKFMDGGLALVGQAAGLTAALFVALSSAVFVTRKDFSFLRTTLVFASFATLALILAAFLFGFQLGVVFSGAMVALACLYILYDTSNVALRCDESEDVLAAFKLFGSLMLLFYYILRILIAFASRE